MYPYYKISKKTKKKKCYIYKKTDGSEKELHLKVHRSFLLFRFFNNKIPESFSPLIPTTLPMHEMHIIYKCVLFSYLSYKDRTKIIFPPEIKMEQEVFDSNVRRIPFFIATDSSTNTIIVSCRGSSCKDDFITDSLGNGITYRGGRFHEGIFSTASYIFMACQTKVLELNELYNKNLIIENDDDSNFSKDSCITYSDDTDVSNNTEEESEEDEDDPVSTNSDEEYYTPRMSTSINNLHLYSKSAVSLQRLASSEEFNLNFNQREKSNKIIQNENANEYRNEDLIDNSKSKLKKKIEKDDSEENNSMKKSMRKSSSNSDLNSRHRSSISLQKSISSNNLFFNSISNLNENSENRKSCCDSNERNIANNESNSIKNSKSKNPYLYRSYKNMQSNSTPILTSGKMRKSTSEDNLNSHTNPTTGTPKKSTSIANLYKHFKSLAPKCNSAINADSENESDCDPIFLNKMREKKTKIIITGHSLGASVAAVVAYLFREKFPELDVQCICFAPPPTISFNVWRNMGKYVKSFMIEGDVVPFLSVRNLLSISDIMFPHQHSNKKFKKLIVSYLEKKSLEKFQINKALSEKLYPPGQMYLIRFTNNSEGGVFTLRKRIKKLRDKRKNKKNNNEVKDDEIQLCQILNPDYFSNLVKNIQENNHAVKNYMRLIIRLMNQFRNQINKHD